MPLHVITQPDGRFAVFSTISDTFRVIDANKDQLIEWWGEQAKQQAIQQLELDLEHFPRSMSLDEALKAHIPAHGTPSINEAVQIKKIRRRLNEGEDA